MQYQLKAIQDNANYRDLEYLYKSIDVHNDNFHKLSTDYHAHKDLAEANFEEQGVLKD